MPSPEAEPPFIRIGPDRPVLPVIISVPHAGRAYSAGLLRSARLPLEKLESLEDRLVDRLIWRAVAAGAAALVAQAPRAEIDLNRDEREIDPTTIVPPPPLGSLLQSTRSRSGLGLIPSRLAGAGSIWLHRIGQDELRRRVEDIHRPYHETLARMLEEARGIFGMAILLDCHSMPTRNPAAGEAGLVFGDRHGTTIAPDLLDAATLVARSLNFTVARNIPYAGGYVTTTHGRPSAGIHALQLEIDRSLYLDASMREPGEGFDRAARLVEAITLALAQRATGTVAVAAE
jgi:N-formylglutamate amidohydrolase